MEDLDGGIIPEGVNRVLFVYESPVVVKPAEYLTKLLLEFKMELERKTEDKCENERGGESCVT